MRILLQLRRMLWKDAVLESRSLSDFGAAIVFAVLAAALVGFAVDRYASMITGNILIGLGLMLVELFLSVFTAIMSFVREADKGTLDGIRASPVEPVIIFVSKTLFTLLVLEALMLVSIASAYFFGGKYASQAWSLAPLLMAAGIYLSAVSAFSSAIAIYVEARGVLLPTLILVLGAPLLQDIVVFSEEATARSIALLTLSGLGFMIVSSWLARYIIEI